MRCSDEPCSNHWRSVIAVHDTGPQQQPPILMPEHFAGHSFLSLPSTQHSPLTQQICVHALVAPCHPGGAMFPCCVRSSANGCLAAPAAPAARQHRQHCCHDMPMHTQTHHAQSTPRILCVSYQPNANTRKYRPNSNRETSGIPLRRAARAGWLNATPPSHHGPACIAGPAHDIRGAAGPAGSSKGAFASQLAS